MKDQEKRETILLGNLKDLILRYFKGKDVKIFLFGSHARENHSIFSDIDIGVVPGKDSIGSKLTLLREILENSNVPFTVDLVDLSTVSDDFLKSAMKGAEVWKS